MKYLFLVVSLFLFSCHKEQQLPECTPDDTVTLTLFNGFAYSVDVTATKGTETFGYIINPGKRITLLVSPGNWNVKAHWNDGNGPFAHNSGDFDKVINVQDCPVAELNYPF